MELLKALYLQYIYFGPFFVFVLAISRLISKEKLLPNYFYSLSYMFMGLGMLQVLSYSIKPFDGYWYVSFFLIPFTFGTPLFLYIRFRFLIQGHSIKVSPLVILTLISIAIFIASGPLFNKNFIREYVELRPLLEPSFRTLPIYFKIAHIINFSSKIVLSSGLLSLLLNTVYLWKDPDRSRLMISRIAYIFTILMFLTSLLGLFGDIFTFELSKAALAMVNTVTLGVFFASQYDSGYYAIFKYVRSKKKYASSKVRGVDISSILERLNTLMVEEKLYLEDDLNIKKVSDLLGINHQQLSEILNRQLGMSFTSYINSFRIKQAKKLLLEDDSPVIRIAMAVGFNSVRTFNRAFSKATGVSPMEYRKRKG